MKMLSAQQSNCSTIKSLSVCGNFKYTERAAEIIRRHPEVIMHLALGRLSAGAPIVIRNQVGEEVLFYSCNGFQGIEPTFSALDEVAGPVAHYKRRKVPAYPHVVTTCQLMADQALTEQRMYQECLTVERELRDQLGQDLRVRQFEFADYWQPMVIPPYYRGVNLLEFYATLYSFSRVFPDLQINHIADLGTGLSYSAQLLALLTEGKVTAFEFLTVLAQEALLVNQRFVHLLGNRVELVGQSYLERNVWGRYQKAVDFAYVWREYIFDLVPFLQSLQVGAHLLVCRHGCKDLYSLSLESGFRHLKQFQCLGESFSLYQRV